MNALYTDLNTDCCAWLGSRVEDGSLPPGDVLLADVRDLGAEHLHGYDAVHLFAGIGGFPLGLAWAGWPACVRVLTGGFPCQDVSAAGKGAGIGTADNPTSRSGLFWELRRIAGLYRTDVCILENVGALSRRGLDTVAAAMGEAGYVVPDAYRVGAWAVGAPHKRERWWIVCYRDGGKITDPGRVQRGHEETGRGDGAGAVAAWSDQGCSPQPDAGEAGRRAVGIGEAGSVAHESGKGGTVADARGERRGEGRGPQKGTAAGWRDPPTGPWRRDGDEWLYAGPPVLVYSSGAGLGQRVAPAVAGGPRHVAGRPDPTESRGWPVPVLPGFEQHDWELPRLYQRGVGDAVHGLPGRLAPGVNRGGVMALGNAVVPEVVRAVAEGIIDSQGWGRA